MPKYGVKPIVPQEKNKFTPNFPGVFSKQWVSEALSEAAADGAGWDTLEAIFEEEALVIYNMEGEPSAVTDRNKVLDDALLEVVQASIEGRLFIREKGTDDLKQLRTQVGEADDLSVSLSEPVKDVKGLFTKEVTAEKPAGNPLFSWFFKLLDSLAGAFSFLGELPGMIAAGFRKKEAPVGEVEVPAPRKEADQGKKLSRSELKQRKKAMETLDKTIMALEEVADKPLSANGIAQEDERVQTGYYDACDRFMEGRKARLNLLKELKEGNTPQNLEQDLEQILLGEMMYRSVHESGVERGGTIFLQSLADKLKKDPNGPYAQWKQELMSTPAAQALLKGTNDDLIRVLGSDAQLNTLMNNVLTQTRSQEQVKQDDGIAKVNEVKRDKEKGPSMIPGDR